VTFFKKTKYIEFRNPDKRGISLSNKIKLYDKDGIICVWCYDGNKKFLGEVILNEENDTYQ